MDINEIRDLIEMVSQSNVSEVELERKNQGIVTSESGSADKNTICRSKTSAPGDGDRGTFAESAGGSRVAGGSSEGAESPHADSRTPGRPRHHTSRPGRRA